LDLRPAGARSALGTTGQDGGVFMQLAMSQEFTSSVFRCGAISMAVALAALFVATRNVVVALLAELSILCITVAT